MPAVARDSLTFKSTDGATVLRLRVWDQWNLTGAYMAFKGTTSCTASYYDIDQGKATFPDGWSGLDHWYWNDAVVSATDHNSCDVKFYEDTHFNGIETNWLDFGSGGANVSDKAGNWWDDNVSSLRIT